jgi:hypothetical protein
MRKLDNVGETPEDISLNQEVLRGGWICASRFSWEGKCVPVAIYRHLLFTALGAACVLHARDMDRAGPESSAYPPYAI